MDDLALSIWASRDAYTFTQAAYLWVKSLPGDELERPPQTVVIVRDQIQSAARELGIQPINVEIEPIYENAIDNPKVAGKIIVKYSSRKGLSRRDLIRVATHLRHNPPFLFPDDTANEPRTIRPRKPLVERPIAVAIDHAIDAFESQHGYTPGFDEFWIFMRRDALKSPYIVKVRPRDILLTDNVTINRSSGKKSFNGRFSD